MKKLFLALALLASIGSAIAQTGITSVDEQIPDATASTSSGVGSAGTSTTQRQLNGAQIVGTTGKPASGVDPSVKTRIQLFLAGQLNGQSESSRPMQKLRAID